MAALALAFGLALCGSPAVLADEEAPLGRLNWGQAGDGAPWTAASLQARIDEIGTATTTVVKRAEATLQQPVKATVEFHQQSVLFTRPEYQESQASAAQLEDAVYPWAMCARVARPPLNDSCRSKAAGAIQTWVATYQPTGAPVDEANLIPLFQSIDLMLPLLPDGQRNAALSWLRQVIKHNDDYYAKVSERSASKTNNHASWSFSLRALESAVVGDPAEQDISRRLLALQIARNINADGSTIDLAQRDALHYQAYDLEPLVQALLLVPEVLDADGEAAILRGVQFLAPFVSGQQQHVEFVASKVPFDSERRQAGDKTFADAPWQPRDASRLLLLAQAHFPSIRSWAAAAAEGERQPRLRQMAALYTTP